MGLPVRRVVTGHDAAGKSVVRIDEVTRNVISRRAGHSSAVIWANVETPADNGGNEDGAETDVGLCADEGAIFRVVEYAPGVSARMHRTRTIDYAVVMSGEIDMRVDDDIEVRLRAGDLLVQRGTVHDWINRGSEACMIAFVLIASKPVETAGGPLGPTG